MQQLEKVSSQDLFLWFIPGLYRPALSVLILLTLLGITEELPAQVSTSAWYNVCQFGADPTAKGIQTNEFQRAVEQIRQQGGGTLVVPAGKYILGTVELCSNITLHLEAGAVLQASDDTLAFPKNGLPQTTISVMLYANCKKNIRISGAGTLQGDPHYDRAKAVKYDMIARQYELAAEAGVDLDVPIRRPPHVTLLFLKECENVRVDGISVLNSPFWAIHLQWCNQVKVDAISIQSDLVNGVNSDGLDIDGCRDVVVSNCFISTGDDAIVLKTTNSQGNHRPCENISVTNCVLESSSCALKLGTESINDFRRILFSNCIIKNTNRGLGIFMRDGGKAENIVFENLLIECNRKNFHWWGDGEMAKFLVQSRRSDSPGGLIRNVTLRNIDAFVSGTSAFSGENEKSIQDLVMEDITIHWRQEKKIDKRATHTLTFEKISGIHLHGIDIRHDSLLQREADHRAIVLNQCNNIYLEHISTPRSNMRSLAQIKLMAVQNAIVKELRSSGKYLIEVSGNSKELVFPKIARKQIFRTHEWR